MKMKPHSRHNTTPPAWALWGIYGVLALAALLRVYHITHQSIWFDEAFAWNIIIQDNMYPRISTDTHPPLYYLMLRGWVTLTGDSALALRYLSALISLMTVAVVYQVGRALCRAASGRGAASVALTTFPILAALMVALSDAEIFLAQEARNYALYSFLAALSMWLYLRWLYVPNARRAVGWAVALAALMWTHYQGVFIPAVQGLHVLLFLRGRKRLAGVGTLVLGGLLVLPWFAGVTVPQAKNALDKGLPFAIPSNWDILLHLRNNYFGAQWALLLALAGVGVWALYHLHNPPGRGAALRPGRIIGRGDASPLQRMLAGSDRVFLVGMWAALPFGVLWVGNYFMALLTERKLLIIVPAVSLLIGAGLAWLRSPARTLFTLAILLHALTSVDYYRVKEPWDEITAHALPYMQPSDLALVEAGVGQYPVKYYWTRTAPPGVVFDTRSVLGDATLTENNDWYAYYQHRLPGLMRQNQADRVGDVATVWLVEWGGHAMVWDALANNGYVRTMTIDTNHIGNTIHLYRYDALPDSPVGAYANGMTLCAVEMDAEHLRVDLWWRVDAPVDADYTTAVMLLDAGGRPVAQKDSPPFDGERPTSSWNAGEVVFDPKPLEPADGIATIPPGDYTVIVKVYLWSPEGITDIMTPDGAPWLDAGTLTVP